MFIPSFLKLDLTIWGIFIVMFAIFAIYIYKLPDEKIEDYKAKTIEKKKELGIKIYKMN